MSLFSSPTPAPSAKSLAATALRSAGLIDRDAQMRDASEIPGGRKGKLRSGRTRLTEIAKDRSTDTRMQSTRLSTNSHAGPSDPLAIRGASRPTVAGRLRRNAVSNAIGTSASSIPVRIKSKPVEAWRELVQKRWNPETRYLNLDSIIQDEVVKKHNLTPPGFGGSPKDAAVIFKLASQLKPEVQTLSLADNNLTGMLLNQLCRYLPNIVNLSLENNNIRDKKEISMIVSRPEKMPHLRELILIGNPVREQAYKVGTGGRYRSEMVRRFPSLTFLDKEVISQISFDSPQSTAPSFPVEKPNATSFPFEMGPSFVTGVDGSLVSNFLVRFFNAFDSQRHLLIDAYDPSATFSFSANTAIPARARLEGFHSSRDMPNQRKLEWKTWLDGSRNLTRIGADPLKTLENLHIGSEQVMKALTSLPPTRHDIGGPAEKFSLDSFPVPHGQSMGLLLTVHGQFTEVGTGGIRSFDRTFMLVPAPDNSRAKLNGWTVVILSDQWIIRSYSSHEAWKPGPMLVQAATNSSQSTVFNTTTTPLQFSMTSLPPDQQAAVASLPEGHRNLVLQICVRTGLNAKFAVDCLSGNAWDLERAVANFDQVKATLSRDAFL